MYKEQELRKAFPVCWLLLKSSRTWGQEKQRGFLGTRMLVEIEILM